MTMSDAYAAAIPPPAPGLTQTQRVVYTFTAPSKTFQDVKRNATWWVPFLMSLVVTVILFFSVQSKVGFQQVAENQIRMSPKRAEQMDKLTPEQRAQQMKISVIVTEVIFAIFPVFAIIGTLIIAGVLLATINFGFGGKATFGNVFSMSWYAHLPLLIKTLLGIVALYAGLAPESFDSQNFSGTNVGYYLPADTNKALMSLATSLDVTTIWSLVLMAIGLSIVAGTKRTAGYVAVFGWWIVTAIVGAGIAAIFS
jgi:hypothetical protein